jgi:hypothetical protein
MNIILKNQYSTKKLNNNWALNPKEIELYNVTKEISRSKISKNYLRFI